MRFEISASDRGVEGEDEPLFSIVVRQLHR